MRIAPVSHSTLNDENENLEHTSSKLNMLQGSKKRNMACKFMTIGQQI